jgi:hypothetical protein
MALEDNEQRKPADRAAGDQEHDALLAASAKLVAEMQSLLERAHSLHIQNVEILKKLKTT